MESYAAGEGSARSDSRERRSDSQHPKGKSKKDSRSKQNASNRGTNWQRYDSNSRPNFASYSDSPRPDVRPKIPTLKCEGIPFNNKRQNKSVKAECFVNLVYEDDRSSRRDRPIKSASSSRKTTTSSRRNVYTTENYMQANCQFVVDNNSGSSVANKLREDPDYAPPWDTICEVRLIASSEPNCPICMNKPIARRITTCGHLFCLPCLIHYFTIKAEKTVPCPICFTKIDISCMKPVSIVHCIEYAVGDSITLVLSRCRKGTTVVEPVDADSSTTRLSNVVYASKVEMISRLEADKDQLRKILENPSSADSTEEALFIREAIKSLENDIMQIEMSEDAQNNSLEMVAGSPPKPDNIVYYVDALHDLKHESKPDSAIGDFPEGLLGGEKSRQESPTVHNAASCTVDSSKPGEIDNSYYYFYQSMDGQRIYLNSFNVRCLLRQFSHLSRCPAQLEGKIIGIEYVNVTADVRCQFRYLSHLPLYSHFQSAEIELDAVLSPEVLLSFTGEIERRQTERALKQTKEDAYSRRAGTLMERMTEAASGITPLALDEPLVYDHAAFLADSPCLFSANAVADVIPDNNPESPNNGSIWTASSSFARILTEGRPVVDNDFPQLGSPPSIPPSPAIMLTTAPGSRASSSASRIAHQNRVNSSPAPLAKVKLAKLSSSVPSQQSLPAVLGVNNEASLTAEDEDELAYAAPEAPRTLADCLSNLNFGAQPESPSAGANWKKSKKKSEARLLFSSGRGHALLN